MQYENKEFWSNFNKDYKLAHSLRFKLNSHKFICVDSCKSYKIFDCEICMKEYFFIINTDMINITLYIKNIIFMDINVKFVILNYMI